MTSADSKVLPERAATQLAQEVVARVGVDALAPGRAEESVALERQARRVRQQVPHGRLGRAGRLVEVEQALLGGDQHGHRGERLGHRGPS